MLVVDDSPFDRQLVGKLLESLPEIEVIYAESLASGMQAIARESPSIVHHGPDPARRRWP